MEAEPEVSAGRSQFNRFQMTMLKNKPRSSTGDNYFDRMFFNEMITYVKEEEGERCLRDMNGTYQMEKKIVDRTHRGENTEHPADDGNGEVDFPLGFGTFLTLLNALVPGQPEEEILP